MADDDKTRLGLSALPPMPTLRDIEPVTAETESTPAPKAPAPMRTLLATPTSSSDPDLQAALASAKVTQMAGASPAQGNSHAQGTPNPVAADLVPTSNEIRSRQVGDSDFGSDELSTPGYGVPSLSTNVGQEPAQPLYALDQPIDPNADLFINRYLVEEQLGEGGMGQVYRVKCLRLGKHFALKRMHGDIAANQELRDLFYREARLASSLQHPNIVSIVDYGEDPKLGAFMVMELAPGTPLSKRLATGPMPLRTMTHVILQIADALHHIHTKGVVHGDIKPDNILLNRADRSDRRRWDVMLLDFGLATLRSQDDSKAERVSGTPPYMAPERIQGAGPHPAQDIYALGILAYQLTTGHLPFNGTITEVLAAHVTKSAPPFKAMLDTEVDPRLEELIFKAIAKDPADRHKDMAAFIYELRTLINMLGFGRKRGGFKQVSTTTTKTDTRLNMLKATAFEISPVPMALVNSDGSCATANPSFVRFLGFAPNEDLTGKSVLTERFTRIVPSLEGDLAVANATRKPVRKAVNIRKGSQVTKLFVGLTPDPDSKGPVLVTIQSSQG